MNKVIGIYFKKKTKRHNEIISKVKKIIPLSEQTNNAFDFFINGCFYVVSYRQLYRKSFIKVTENNVLGYVGFIHLNTFPLSDIDEHIFSELKNNSFDNNIIRGKYVIYNYDISKNELILHNDLLGLFPLFYYDCEELFCFSSDFEAILSLFPESGTLSKSAIFEYFAYGSPIIPKTFFERIFLLKANSKVTIKNNIINIEKKNDYIIYPKINYNSITDITKEYYKYLREEIELITKWYPDFSVTLTGGSDTRMIFSLLNEEERKNRIFKTFRSKFIDDNINQDIIIASKIAQLFSLKYYTIDSLVYANDQITDEYFKCLRNFSECYISGYSGSETLRARQLFSVYLNKLVRLLIVDSNFKYDEDDNYLFRHVHVGVKFFKLYKKLSKYISLTDTLKIRELFVENKSFLKELSQGLDVKFKEIIFLNKYITSSFFSNICGGFVGNILLPCYVTRNFITPFLRPELLFIVANTSPKFLVADENGFIYNLFKTYFREFLSIEINSRIGNKNNTLIPLISEGVRNVDVAKIDYEKHFQILRKEYTILKEKYGYVVFFDVLMNTKEVLDYKWMDFLLFLHYVGNVKSQM